MQLYQFCFSHQKTLIFVLRTVSLAHLGKKTSFFSLDVPNWLCSAQKSRFFYSRIKTAIIAHKLNSQFSQCTAKPAGLQSKTDRKTKKTIALRASSFFTQRKPFVPKFLERKNHLYHFDGIFLISMSWKFYFQDLGIRKNVIMKQR